MQRAVVFSFEERFALFFFFTRSVVCKVCVQSFFFCSRLCFGFRESSPNNIHPALVIHPHVIQNLYVTLLWYTKEDFHHLIKRLVCIVLENLLCSADDDHTGLE